MVYKIEIIVVKIKVHMNVRGKGVYIRETETDLVYDTHIFTIGSVQQLLLMARIIP